MLIHTVPHRAVDATCLASARRWRTHAELLRDGAEAPALTTGQRTTLLRDAAAAERQARARLFGEGRDAATGSRPELDAADRTAIAEASVESVHSLAVMLRARLGAGAGVRRASRSASRRASRTARAR